jgi:tRNA(His) 5'-end guanylyltransferase
MKKDELGDRMKLYEKVETGQRFFPYLPICARIDGRNFSTWTKRLKRPYDDRLSEIMQVVTKILVEETNALMGYTQSDEISLIWLQDEYKSQLFFDSKKQKMTSVLASIATANFNIFVGPMIPEKAGRLALFDCRVWQVPSKEEGANVFLWRELDATRNSIESAVRTVYSHRQVFGKNQKEMQEMMFQRGINWNDYPAFFKRGTFIQKRCEEKTFTEEEIKLLPEKHKAKENKNLIVKRSEVKILDMPQFSKVTNRVGVIFNFEEPRVAGETLMDLAKRGENPCKVCGSQRCYPDRCDVYLFWERGLSKYE